MALEYPLIILIGILLIGFIVLFKFKTNNKFHGGKKIANVGLLNDSVYYKKLIKKYHLYKWIILGLIILIIIVSLLLSSRVVKVSNKKEEYYNRDIMLCMDVSSSVNNLNEQLVDSLKKIVKDLKGERFGISIFNSSSVLLVPLTDDYDYIDEVLNVLYKAFNSTNDINHTFNDEYMYLLRYIQSGTIVNSQTRGSSLISDGLASCVYSFPKLNEKRTRSIIFSTDNDLRGTPYISLLDAAKLSRDKKISVYAIAPRLIKAKDATELQKAAELTNGEYYLEPNDKNVDDIVNNINKKEKSLFEAQEKITKVDQPVLPLIILIGLLFIVAVLIRKVEK